MKLGEVATSSGLRAKMTMLSFGAASATGTVLPRLVILAVSVTRRLPFVVKDLRLADAFAVDFILRPSCLSTISSLWERSRLYGWRKGSTSRSAPLKVSSLVSMANMFLGAFLAMVPFLTIPIMMSLT